MRSNLLLIIGVLAFIALVAPAKAQLKICNKTPIELWTAIGFVKNDRWYAQGWYKTSAGGCATPIRGKLTNRYYYYRSKNNMFKKYLGHDNVTFCVHPSDSFGPTRDGRCPNGFEDKEFSKIDIGKKAKSYTLNITCKKCRNPEFQISGNDLVVNYLHRDTIQGRKITFPVSGRFTTSGSKDKLRVSYKINVGLNDVQKNMTAMLRPMVNQSDGCGDNVKLRNVNLRPHSAGRARVDVNLDYERWYCTYADIPETRCTDTWISLPFGGKTKGIPKCSVTMKTKRTSKNRVAETGINGTLVLTPSVFNRNRVRLAADVTNVTIRNDLVRFIADTLDVDLKRIAQSELQKNLGKGGAIQGAVPAELQPFFRIGTVKFYNRGGGELGIQATGSMQVSFSQIAGLCRKHTGFC